MNSLRFQEFKDASFRFALPLVDKGHTLCVSFRCHAFADNHFKPAFLTIRLLAAVDIATVQSHCEWGTRVRQGWSFIVLWRDKQEAFLSQFSFHPLGNLID